MGHVIENVALLREFRRRLIVFGEIHGTNELLSVRVRFLGGSAWYCRRRDPCGVYDLPDRSYAQRLNRVNLLPPRERRAKGFDGEIVLARAAPSPPACRRRPDPP